MNCLIPDYYEDFHCKCGLCRRPCCDGWGINVTEHEYFKLLGLACPDRLRHKLDDALVLSPFGTADAYAHIRPNYLAQCPMLDDDGLCLLQKEKGEEELPLVCRLYPRAVKRYGSLTELALSCSCEAAVELIAAHPGPLSLHPAEIRLPFDGIPVYDADPARDALRHRLIELVSTPGRPLDERLAEVCALVCDRPPRHGAPRGEALRQIRDYALRLSEVSDSLRDCAEAALLYLSTEESEGSDGSDGFHGGASDGLTARFDRAEAHLYALVPDLDSVAGRLIANHMLYESFPYTPDCESPDTAFAALCTAVALLKFILVGGMAESDERTRFVDLLAAANRFVEHSDFYRVVSRVEHPKGAEVWERFEAELRREGDREGGS